MTDLAVSPSPTQNRRPPVFGPLGPARALDRPALARRARRSGRSSPCGWAPSPPRSSTPSPAPAGRPRARSRSPPATSSSASSEACPAPRCRSSSTADNGPRHLGPGPASGPGRGRPPCSRPTPAFASVVPPQPGRLDLPGRPDRGAVQAGAATANTNEMVRAADDLKGPLARWAATASPVALTGSLGLWSDFNAANRDAMIKSELISLARHAGDPGAGLRLAGRRRPAADAHDHRAGRGRRLALPRLAGRRHLDLGDELRADVRPGPRHRLRAVPGGPVPRRALRPVGGRRGRPSPRRWTPPARPSCSPASPC